MIKVVVSAPDGDRSFEGDGCFVTVVQTAPDGAIGVRSFSVQPPGWVKGMEAFLAAVDALREVAEAPGDERHRLAARSALLAIDQYDPK